jgi:hypothetical protein
MAEVANVQSVKFDATPEDTEAQKLLAEWGLDGSVHSADGSVSIPDDDMMGYDDYLERFRRDVDPGDKELDHIILGCSDLDAAAQQFEELTGVKPVMVVSLKGVGIQSARIAFEDCSFLEIVGPDPKQNSMPMSQALSELEPGKLIPLHYAVRDSEVQETKPWKEAGLDADRVTMVAVDRGVTWKWVMNILGKHDQGGLMPYFVDWGDAHHAAGRLPVVGRLDRVTVQTSSGSPIHSLLEDVTGLNVTEGADLLEFTIVSEKGTHTFSSSSPLGLTFPGKDE